MTENIEAVARVTFLSDGSIMLERQACDGTWSTIALDNASMMTTGNGAKGEQMQIGFVGRVAGPVHSHATAFGDFVKVRLN